MRDPHALSATVPPLHQSHGVLHPPQTSASTLSFNPAAAVSSDRAVTAATKLSLPAALEVCDEEHGSLAGDL